MHAAGGPKPILTELELHPVTSVFLGKVDFCMKGKEGTISLLLSARNSSSRSTVTEFKVAQHFLSWLEETREFLCLSGGELVRGQGL